jgi:hypothetical protein
MMKSQKFFRLALPLVLTLVLVSSAHAVKVCFDYALFRAAQQQGIGGCDPTPASSPQNPYLSTAVLQTRLSSLGYRRVSDNDAIAFGRNAFNTPGFAERFLKPGDVIFLRTDHVGFVVPGPRIDHFIQVPGASGTPYNANALPGPTTRVVGDRTLTGGFFGTDRVEDFLHIRTHAQGGGVEVWRPQVPPNANARQIACPPMQVAGGNTAQAAHPIGCFRDQGNPTGTSGRDLNGFVTHGPNMTTAACINECQQRGYKYAGTQYSSWCFCGNSYGRSGTANNCNMACSGSPAEICGGSWANSVYGASR